MDSPVGVALVLGVGAFLLYRGSKQVMLNEDEEVDAMARTAWGEARGEGKAGMQAVINVIMNRVKKGGWWGATPKEVCTKPAQFSVWNKSDPNYAPMLAVTESDSNFALAKQLAVMAYNGMLPDITNGATNYLALKSLSTVPSWTNKMKQVASIGNHTFYA